MGCAKSRVENHAYEFLILGREKTGKTTLINSFSNHDMDAPGVDVKISITEIRISDYVINLSEVRSSLVDSWSNYWNNRDGIFYMIDGTDSEADDLQMYIGDIRNIAENTKSTPMIIYITKNDLGLKIDVNELINQIDVIMKVNKRYYKIFKVSCTDEASARKGLDDLLQFYNPSCTLIDKRQKYGSTETSFEMARQNNTTQGNDVPQRIQFEF